MPLLNPGDQFPRLTITTTGDQTLTFPDAFAGDFGVVLLYRGSWCLLTRWDEEIRAEGEEALSLTGRDVGTPIIHFGPPGRRGVLRPGDQQAPQSGMRPSGSGTTSRPWPPSPASPSSSGACASGPSCAASASCQARPEQRKTGTPGAASPRRSPRQVTGRRGSHPHPFGKSGTSARMRGVPVGRRSDSAAS